MAEIHSAVKACCTELRAGTAEDAVIRVLIAFEPRVGFSSADCKVDHPVMEC